MIDIKINEEIEDTLTQIEELLSNYQVEIKQMKRPKKEEKDEDSQTIHIIGHYNKKGFKKNELIRKITSIQNVEEVLQEDS